MQETLAIGSVPLYLGMAKADVLSKLHKAGYDVNPDSYVVLEKSPGGSSSIIGVVAFENEKLSFINRDWIPDNNTPDTIGRGIYGVFREMEQRGRTACTIQTSDEVNPLAELRYVIIRCRPGQSYVSIGLVRSKIEGVTATTVEEILRK